MRKPVAKSAKARTPAGPASTAAPSKPAPAAKPAKPINPVPLLSAPLPSAQPAGPDVVLSALSSTGPGKPSQGHTKTGVVVVGSLNMDLLVRTETMPAPGQTVLGQDLLQSPGGKGANQAVAVARLWQKRTPAGGGGARMIGRIGDDLFGQNILGSLEKFKIDPASVLVTKNAPTGTAIITVDRHGENAIVVAGGANRHLSSTDLLAQRKAIEASSVLLAQLEIPHDTVACAFALAKRSNVITILDPAPAPAEGLPESLYHVDVLTPNQFEAQLLTGMPIRTPDDARRAAERFLTRGTRVVIVKMGSQGAVIVYRQDSLQSATITHNSPVIAHHIPGFRVAVADTTAAGDAFTGALAVALAEGMPLRQAVRFANAAGALTCTKRGAISSLPARAEVQALLAQV